MGSMPLDKRARYSQLFVEQYARLLRYACTIVVDPELAKDIVSEAFVKFWFQIGNIDDDKVAHYLTKSVKNLCIDHLRQMSLFDEYTHELIKAYDEIYVDTRAEIEKDLMVERMLNRLDDEERQVIEMAYIKKMKHAEIGEKFGISAEAVRKRIYKTLDFLRETFKNHPYDD